MRRRSFLRSGVTGAAALAAGLGGGLAPAQTTDSRGNEGAAGLLVPQGQPAALMGPEAVAGYFSEERMRETLGLAAGAPLRAPKQVQVVAYNFPSWHASPWMEARFGKGWTEWDTLREARTLFPGHTMPHYPLWGYYDEADPAWAAKEIDLASSYGVDAWMIDWYWHEGTQFYQEQLEQGLLKAANREKLKFAVMWANHDWKNVYPARSPNAAAVIFPQVHTLADFERVAEYCAEHYWHEPNYLKIGDLQLGDPHGGAPVFSIFDASKLVEQLGGVDGAKRGLSAMRERAAKLGFSKLHLQVASGYEKYQGRLKEMGFDSVTQYGTFGWTYGAKPAGSRIPYGVGCAEGVKSWAKGRAAAAGVPFYPCVQVGWDDSPRFGEYAAVAINRSPDQFERMLRAARHAVAEDAGQKLVYVAAWNEWTEDHVLLPDSIWGYGYLEAVRRAMRG